MKMIRLAVIGSTSSGKTYLLNDMIESFSRLGYRCEEELDLYANPYSFRERVLGPDGVHQTPVAQCRKYSEYRGNFVNRAMRRNFNLGFLDIPGEIFTSERIDRFISIIGELYHLGSCFTYDVYRRGRETSKVLRFVGPNESELPSEEYQRIITEMYEKRGYEKLNYPPRFCRNVTGRKLVKRFFDFDTDSVVEAITQAVPFFRPDANIDQQVFRQLKVGMDLFYFFYTLCATDVVLCDKLVLPASFVGTASKISSPVEQMQRLYRIAQFHPCEKKYYMAFRGCDALINDCLGDLAKRGFDINKIYALIVFLLEYKLQGRNLCPLPEMEQYLGSDVCRYLREHSIPSSVSHFLSNTYAVQPYYNQHFANHAYGVDLIKALFVRIQAAVRDFMELRSDLPEEKDIFMAQNVFLTSSAIANEMFAFQVTGNDASNVQQMGGPCEHHPNRALFGTLQLVMSLFTRNKICFESNADEIALIQDYIS